MNDRMYADFAASLSLLTDEEIESHFDGDMPVGGFDVLLKDFQNRLRQVIKAQDTKTRKETLKEVVDWVDKHTYPIYRPYSGGSQVFCSEDWDIQLKEWGL